jgi:hypothetical protein
MNRSFAQLAESVLLPIVWNPPNQVLGSLEAGSEPWQT